MQPATIEVEVMQQVREALEPDAASRMWRAACGNCSSRAKLNAEMEQTARESTTGPPKPLGRRGAKMADTISPARA